MAIRPRGTPISASRSRMRCVMFDCTLFSICAALGMPPALATAANAAKSPAPMPALIFPTVGKPDGFSHKKAFFMQGFKAYFSQPGARGRRPPTRPSPQRCAPDRPCARTTRVRRPIPSSRCGSCGARPQGTDGLDGVYVAECNTTPSDVAFSRNVPPSTGSLQANREPTQPATESAQGTAMLARVVGRGIRSSMHGWTEQWQAGCLTMATRERAGFLGHLRGPKPVYLPPKSAGQNGHTLSLTRSVAMWHGSCSCRRFSVRRQCRLPVCLGSGARVNVRRICTPSLSTGHRLHPRPPGSAGVGGLHAPLRPPPAWADGLGAPGRPPAPSTPAHRRSRVAAGFPWTLPITARGRIHRWPPGTSRPAGPPTLRTMRPIPSRSPTA